MIQRFQPEDVERLKDLHAAHMGGYLRNTIRQPMKTCSVCTTPVGRWPQCYRCNEHLRVAGPGYLADAVAALFYGIEGRQSGHVMYGYKATPRVDRSFATVAVTTFLGLHLHGRCAGALAGIPITNWAIVASRRGRPEKHPLYQFVPTIARGAEVQVIGRPRAQRDLVRRDKRLH